MGTAPPLRRPREFALRLPSGFHEGDRELEVTASLWLPELPELPAAAPALLLCLPGGNMNRRYFGLVDEHDGSVDTHFSFAAQMTARGYMVAALDYLACGGSDAPADGWSLTPERLAQAAAVAVHALVQGLRAGTLHEALAVALPSLRVIGVGHSMGAMMTILLQDRARPFAALVLLGFSTRGLSEYLPEDLRRLADDPAAVRAQLVPCARQLFATPYPKLPGRGRREGLFHSAKLLPGARDALKSAAGHLLALPGLLSMLPGNVAAEAARIDVPVFLGVGDHDITGNAQTLGDAFPVSADVYVAVLPDTGHAHFLFAGREKLYPELCAWLQARLS